MIELVYRFDPESLANESRPPTAADARVMLESGNEVFVQLLDSPVTDGDVVRKVMMVRAADIGFAASTAEQMIQEPFALVLGCADARAPIELVFNQGANDLFVLRVAGNVLGQEILGSVDYAIDHLPTIRLLVVLGHSHCGAVTATVDAFLDAAGYLGFSKDHQLRSIVNQLFPAVRLGYDSLHETYGRNAADSPGYREALTETSSAINAALMASLLQFDLDAHRQDQIKAVFGIYDLDTRRVDVPGVGKNESITSRLLDPPADADGFRALGLEVSAGPVVRRLMEESVPS